MHVRACNSTTDFVQKLNYFYYKGTESEQSEQQHEVWEPSLVNAMKARLGPGKHFVDIGANEGYFSLYAAALGATITAFEPVK